MNSTVAIILTLVFGLSFGALFHFAFMKARPTLQPMSNDRLKMIFGFGVLLELGVLAALVGLGKVEMQTSYGLNIILGSLATLAGGFAQWAFSSRSQEELNQMIVKAVEAALAERLKAVEALAARPEAKAA